MSDDNGGFQIFGFPMPPEIQREMEEAQNVHQMSIQNARHQIQSLFTDLDREHLFALRILLHSIVANKDIHYAAYCEGLAAAQLQSRFNVCPGCGENHEEEFLKDLANEADDAYTGAHLAQSTQYGVAEQPSLFESDPEDEEKFTPTILTYEQLRCMEDYNLDDLRDEDTHKLLGFICKSCGKSYVSIEDRMRRPSGVEGCDGCIQKAKWG